MNDKFVDVCIKPKVWQDNEVDLSDNKKHALIQSIKGLEYLRDNSELGSMVQEDINNISRDYNLILYTEYLLSSAYHTMH